MHEFHSKLYEQLPELFEEDQYTHIKEIPYYPADLYKKFPGAFKKHNDELLNRTDIYMDVSLPKLEKNIMYSEKVYAPPIQKQQKKVVSVRDPELLFDNPAETKHLMMLSAHRVIFDKDLKPTKDEKEKIDKIIAYPPMKHLTEEEKELIWKFCYYLQNNPRALMKFVKSVDWNHPKQAKHAMALLEKWAKPKIDDALEILSHRFQQEQALRDLAVRYLEQVPDEELSYYLLSLVQALRYDRYDAQSTENSSLLNFLIKRAQSNFKIANDLFWFLDVEAMKINDVADYTKKRGEFQLGMFTTPTGMAIIHELEKQRVLIRQLMDIAIKMKNSSLSREAKRAEVQAILAKTFAKFETTAHPLHPGMKINSIDPAGAHVFRSANQPIKVTFKNSVNETCSIILKTGDDLRQDQLVIQLISLMDQLLKKENLDLKLIPYKVLALSLDDGILEVVPNAMSVSDVLSDYNGDIKQFLRKNNPDPAGPFGIAKESLDIYVRSCAGYCVITYILGIGDRHLDNILLTKQGHFFHIDFGFILGRDPKGITVPMRITREIIDVMGKYEGVDYYQQFLGFCVEAYNMLRKSSHLILNLLLLMVDSNIPQLTGEKELLEVEKKLRLDLDDGRAASLMRDLINESVNAFGPKFAEILHNVRKFYN
jgi:phosphatidylinositol 3-kinase